ncbi:MAG: N-acetylmuramoyl-L-alanine amidase [Lachnospiraceae bacterium]|nr:N-acetylmuramoyl-L-alanine amidase [Lachnospiraceae bacterium]
MKRFFFITSMILLLAFACETTAFAGEGARLYHAENTVEALGTQGEGGAAKSAEGDKAGVTAGNAEDIAGDAAGDAAGSTAGDTGFLTEEERELIDSLSLSDDRAAADEICEYRNPRRMVIASPKDGLTTTGEHVSILGSCDPNYECFVNGEKIETTEHGFFVLYPELEIGENTFVFRNMAKEKKITIVRKKASGGGGTPENPPVSPFAEGTYGVVTSAYTMTRADIYSQSPDLIPITGGTTLRLLGECEKFYQIYDGTFVSKSAISRKEGKIKKNRIAKAVIVDHKDRNVISLVFDTEVNVPFSLKMRDDGKAELTLFETYECAQVEYADNDTIKKAELVDVSEGRAVIELEFAGGLHISGYDCRYEGGKMIVSMKKPVHLKKRGSLEGAVILLDPGHGTDDPGALGPLGLYGPKEKNFNLSFGLMLRDILTDRGANVVITRTDDSFLELSERVAIIRDLAPDISVSVHGNSLAEVTDYRPAKNFRMFYTYGEFNNAAALMNALIIKNMGFDFEEERSQSLSLTRITSNPAILLETMFLSNPDNYELLLKKDFRQKYALVIADAIEAFLESNTVYEDEAAQAGPA